MRALLRRTGVLTFDPSTHSAARGERPIALSTTEYNLFARTYDRVEPRGDTRELLERDSTPLPPTSCELPCRPSPVTSDWDSPARAQATSIAPSCRKRTGRPGGSRPWCKICSC